MWICPACGQKFKNTNQVHSCRDRVFDDFLAGKSEYTIKLFDHFIASWGSIGKITVHPTKSMIAIASKVRMAYITRLGKNFVDVVFPFDKPYADNLCFHKIAQVPGTSQYNHHLRILNSEDINGEVKRFMKLAFANNRRTAKK